MLLIISYHKSLNYLLFLKDVYFDQHSSKVGVIRSPYLSCIVSIILVSIS